MSDLSRLALREIIEHANRASQEFVSLCVKRQIEDMSTRGSQPNLVLESISRIQSWAEAIQKDKS